MIEIVALNDFLIVIDLIGPDRQHYVQDAENSIDVGETDSHSVDDCPVHRPHRRYPLIDSYGRVIHCATSLCSFDIVASSEYYFQFYESQNRHLFLQIDEILKYFI